MAAAPQNVYFFGEKPTEGDAKRLLGGKGLNLGIMSSIGLPVPQGFTISSEACIYFSKNKKYPQGLRDQIESKLAQLEKVSNKSFGKASAGKKMLLLSIRSGAAISMPGMMDTVLNLGLNDESVVAFAKQMNNERFAWDSYRRFCAMYGDVVMGVPHHEFEEAMTVQKKKAGVTSDTELNTAQLKELVQEYKNVIKKSTGGKMFPQDPKEQLIQAVNAVFESWDNERAITYREMNGISHGLGTAVNVQEMVFGNMSEKSGTGVAFTRNPATGDNTTRYGEFLQNAQGEDVVAGIRTPLHLEEMPKLGGAWPRIYKELCDIFDKLESHYREMQDVEFTIEEEKLYMLQTRKGKRTAAASVKIAVDCHREGLMTKEEAVLSVDPDSIDKLLHPQLDPKSKASGTILGKGLPASPGAAVGKVVFTAAKAVAMKATGEKTILVRLETSPEDISGMDSAQGCLTARGGMTSHAAVVARGMGKPCICGLGSLSFPDGGHGGANTTECTIGNVTIREGDMITLDGSTGEVFKGALSVVEVKIEGDYATVMQWADEIRELEVFTNCDTPKDARKALEFGAQGIGLIRTEHMVFEGDRIVKMREMILSDTLEEREKALAKMQPFFQSDFEGIFKVMTGKPVIIRLLDPPLHEFLPHTEKDMQELSKATGIPVDVIKSKASNMAESNPMLGFRGCRLGIVNPEITEMQVRSILLAALKVKSEGSDPHPLIEVPLVGKVDELSKLRAVIEKVAEQVGAKGKIPYRIGTMIETPRAALTADVIAPFADFMSFGSNDLTQFSCGLSRDDAGSFLGDYVRQGIYERDPFQSIDQEGVGKFMRTTIALARAVKPDMQVGICGEHGGEKASVQFAHRIGLSDVSCSPYRVPTARLAAAHARILYGPKPKAESIAQIYATNRSKL